jgi:hypothetical protein
MKVDIDSLSETQRVDPNHRGEAVQAGPASRSGRPAGRSALPGGRPTISQLPGHASLRHLNTPAGPLDGARAVPHSRQECFCAR